MQRARPPIESTFNPDPLPTPCPDAETAAKAAWDRFTEALLFVIATA
jgi:hypothetical protein